MSVLAGDVGGTKTLLQIASAEGEHIRVHHERRYTSADYPDLLPMLRDFLADAGAAGQGVTAACLAVAGPVSNTPDGDHAQVTNLPWRLDGRALGAALGIPRLRLINDFQGVGHGIAALGADDLMVLQAGEAVPQAPRLVVGAGTGFGAGILVWGAAGYEVIATEGGHLDFAPANAMQDALLAELRAEHGHVSWERLVSGDGLERLYRFCATRRGTTPAPHNAAAISQAALQGGDADAVAALELFIQLYGAHTGNLALACVPRGGVYVAGGIAPQLAERLTRGDFLAAFLAKGRMRGLLETLPVRLVMNARVGLLGAACVALGD